MLKCQYFESDKLLGFILVFIDKVAIEVSCLTNVGL